MSFRWFKSIPIISGLRANVSERGIGWSFGFGVFRIGTSPSGRRWLSIGIPGTNFRYFKFISDEIIIPTDDSASDSFEHMSSSQGNTDQVRLNVKKSVKGRVKWRNLR